MRLILNGEVVEHKGERMLTDVLHALDMEPEQVATLVNNEVVSKENRRAFAVKDGDRIDVFYLCGGGSYA